MERKVQKPIIERKILEAFVTGRKIQEYILLEGKIHEALVTDRSD
jgi:hypothetical protein